MTDSKLRISGRLARMFQDSQITPLLALVCFLLGVFAVLVTPREEEPQINVTMANVLIPFPGASVKDVEQMVSSPAEQVLSQIAGVEHVMSVSQPGMSVVTVQYKVGVPRTEALVRLYDTVHSHADWLPKELGVLQPLIKPKGIDDVPIVSLTLHGKDTNLSAFELERIAQNIEIDLKRVKGTREVTTIGGPSRAIQIDIDPARMQAAGITVPELRMALQAAHLGAPVGDLLVGQQAISIESGPFLSSAKDVASLVVGVRAGTPLHVHDIAQVRDGGAQANTAVWHGVAGDKPSERTAVTIAITKKPGENAIEVADAVLAQVTTLKQSKIPQNVEVTTTRNYGETANDKAKKLIQKLLFATASVVALVFIALGRREAAIVGTAVILTLTVTLFASWAWGFTLNRVSLFALIFSIGILVDDAIVVVENIHRHARMAGVHDAAGLLMDEFDEALDRADEAVRHAGADLHAGSDLRLLRRLRARLTQRLVEQILENRARPLEAVGTDVSQIVRNHIELGLLGIQAGTGNPQGTNHGSGPIRNSATAAGQHAGHWYLQSAASSLAFRTGAPN